MRAIGRILPIDRILRIVRILRIRQIDRIPQIDRTTRADRTRRVDRILRIAPIRRAARNPGSLLGARMIRVAPTILAVRTIPAVRTIRVVPTTRAARTTQGIQHGRKVTARLLVGTVFLGLASFASAQTQEARQFFEQGRVAFERSDHARALEAFEAALAAGMEGPAIHFNIGAAAYRAGAYDKARVAFERVALEPAMASLARYNLGLVALEQNDQQAAIHWFARVDAETEDERLRSLARTQLDLLDVAPQPRRISWALYASSGVGYDDNVTLTSGGQALGFAREGDIYSDTLVAASMQLTEAWRLDADAWWLNYLDLSDFDQWGAGAGARYRFALEPWMLDVGAQVGTSYFDGERFDVRESLYVQAARSFANQLALRTRYRITNIEASDDYPGLTGLSHDLMARVTRRIRSWTAGVTYVFELNDYDLDIRSAQRHRLTADVRVPLSRAWAARGSLTYRYNDFDNAEVGSEQRIEAGAGAELRLTDQWTLAVQYLFTDNDATVREFSYRRNRIFVGIEMSL